MRASRACGAPKTPNAVAIVATALEIGAERLEDYQRHTRV